MASSCDLQSKDVLKQFLLILLNRFLLMPFVSMTFQNTAFPNP